MTILLVSESFAKSHVKGYTKTDGTVVKPHEDKRTKKSPAKWSATGSKTVTAPQYGFPDKKPQASLFGGSWHGGGRKKRKGAKMAL